MPADLVVDTNVFMHAGNPHSRFFQGALAFVKALQASNVPICLDKQNAVSSPSNLASLIWAEYERKMKTPTYGMGVLAALQASQRVRWVSRDVGAVINRRIRRLVPNNTRDKTFLRVAYNSVAHILVSDDSRDFSIVVRGKVQKELSVRIKYSATDFGML